LTDDRERTRWNSVAWTLKRAGVECVVKTAKTLTARRASRVT
jgi:hypothetical protein